MLLIQPIKYWGGKGYIAPKIIGLMPRHLHYVEPYAGGLAVLLEKDPFDQSLFWGEQGYEQGVSEVANDIYGELTNFCACCNMRMRLPSFRGGSKPCRFRKSSGRMPRSDSNP